jgi:hypothetical protein
MSKIWNTDDVAFSVKGNIYSSVMSRCTVLDSEWSGCRLLTVLTGLRAGSAGLLCVSLVENHGTSVAHSSAFHLPFNPFQKLFFATRA